MAAIWKRGCLEQCSLQCIRQQYEVTRGSLSFCSPTRQMLTQGPEQDPHLPPRHPGGRDGKMQNVAPVKFSDQKISSTSTKFSIYPKFDKKSLTLFTPEGEGGHICPPVTYLRMSRKVQYAFCSARQNLLRKCLSLRELLPIYKSRHI